MIITLCREKKPYKMIGKVKIIQTELQIKLLKAGNND
jgi:hypothetical protein